MSKKMSQKAEPVSARALVEAIARRHGLAPGHSAAANAEAEAFLAAPGFDDPSLVDRTNVPFVTIDNPDSRDLDQALHVARVGDGYLLSYALADASYYAPVGSALFEACLERGATYYLPGYAVTMLPRVLCEDIVSLNPNVPRRALLMRMHLDASARCTSTTIERALIRSRANLSYPGVQAYYDSRQASPLAGQPYTISLELLREVGELRLIDARRRDVVQYNRVEVGIGFADAQGMAFSLFGDERLDVERYNEQVSLLCNIEGARVLYAAAGDRVQPIFRVHPAPSEDRLAALEAMIEATIRLHRLDAESWRWRRGEVSLADYLLSLPRARPGDDRIRRAIDRHAMLSNVRSEFTAEPAEHHGIGAPVYARFSAPMRELVGIFTHKEAFEQCGQNTPRAAADDAALRDRVVAVANRSKALQKRLTNEANKLVLDHLFQPDLDLAPNERAWRRGTLMGLRPTRLYVVLDELPVEVKVYLKDMLEDMHGPGAGKVDRAGVALRAKGGRPLALLGGFVDLRVAERLASGRWVFELRGGPHGSQG